MRRAYQLARWRRRAETLERKASELFAEIYDSEGDDSEITSGAHGAYIGTRELTAALTPKSNEE